MLLFTHIEKCAGTSFNEVLSLTYPRYFHVTKNQYGGNETRNDLTFNQYKKIIRYFPSGIGGHSVRPYLDFLPPSNRITFLRNPLERYLSQYNHMLEREWTTSIDDFLNKSFYNNFMTKKIAGTNDFRLAQKLLSDFVFIGNSNEYNKSLNYLQDVLDVKLIGSIERKNQRKDTTNYLSFSDLSTTQKLRAEENNHLDIQLYDQFILQNPVIGNYSDIISLRPPSKLRVKIMHKVNKYKKHNIINPIRLS